MEETVAASSILHEQQQQQQQNYRPEKSSADVTQTSAEINRGRNEEQDDGDDDGDLEPFDLASYKDGGIRSSIPASEEVLTKLLAQAEFYFSDSNVLKDKFLLKTIQTSKGGFVNVKLLSSFRRMQATSKDWRDLSFALRRSDKLELNADGNKVRRKDPLPEWDNKVFDRTVVATNLQLPEVSVNAVKSVFDKCGSVTLVRILQPGKTLPEDLQEFSTKHPELSSRLCAVIEFASEAEAGKAVEEIGGKGDWRAMQVSRLRDDLSKMDGLFSKKGGVVQAGSYKGSKENVAVTSGGGGSGRANVITVDSSPSSSPSTRRKKTSSSSARSVIAVTTTGTAGSIPIHHRRFDSGGFAGSPDRRGSPKPSSYTGAGGGSGDREYFDRRSAPKPIPGRMQYHQRSTPQGSPDLRRQATEESPLSCSPASLGTSPWIRRKALLEQSDPSSSPGRNLVSVTRQPRGPDGSKGFIFARGSSSSGLGSN